MEFLSQIILAKVPITEVIKRYSSDFSEGRALNRCINPAHNDSSPSMKTYKETNSLYCFGCGFSGNPISVVAKLEHCSLTEAMFKLKDWFGIEEDLASLSLTDRTKVQRDAKEFAKTFDFYFKMFIKRNERLPNSLLQQIEDIYQTRDLRQLKQLYEDIKLGRTELL